MKRTKGIRNPSGCFIMTDQEKKRGQNCMEFFVYTIGVGYLFTIPVFLLFFFCWLVRQWCRIWVFGLKIMVERGDEIMRYESAAKLKVKIPSLLFRVCGVGIIAKGTQFHRGVIERVTNILGTRNK
ncbi:hypothetical protein GE21DRAFT_1057431 [Neurospora crassa]|uniref:Uncharacterized protein n=1 Tax=Neurospora crassa (strain ATCC 24698 / 74-OR23-1A / CBS 708.71 / DSM 1257 / FGSC 987) TaxID=367110 RepID=V5IKK8_NEUCR|nr:hypothetical protein NCU17231 [Neurospora crassa OR74A]ESA41957.1 hypothetical protein NCU17231 [Neurospora crassa OR74A]KHE78662.1 hypothetical protein GE21DRAFT_1057431 [Neurospora crassa]|eukprot:XP_011395370.1 hypothetical protein NCU17231 [Neurospora crassa OR74A]